jgi:hypothetical protein
VTGLFRKEELDQEIEEELQFHLAMRTQEKIARGMDPAEADAEARRQLGNINLVKDSWRDVTGGGALEVLWQDVRFAGDEQRPSATAAVSPLRAPDGSVEPG